MPCPCRAAFILRMPCRAPSMLRQCRVLHESPRGSRKYTNCYSNSLTDRLFCSVLLPLFTVVGMDRCEEDVIIACGLYLFAEEDKQKKKN
jgi:hypothetical protein